MKSKLHHFFVRSFFKACPEACDFFKPASLQWPPMKKVDTPSSTNYFFSGSKPRQATKPAQHLYHEGLGCSITCQISKDKVRK
jgi:hypothetical protein